MPIIRSLPTSPAAIAGFSLPSWPGLAGAIAIGSTMLGFLGTERGGDQALASVEPADFWQRTEDIVKGNYSGEIAEVVALKPYSQVPDRLPADGSP